MIAPPAPDLDAWYRSHGEAVFRRGRRLMGADDLAWDVVQETFLRARKYATSYRGGSPLAWLLTIADRVGFTMLKRTKPTLSLDSSPDLAVLASEGHVDSAARVALVRQLIARTDERTALIVVRRYFDEMDLEAIAADLDINERTVRRALSDFLVEARVFANHVSSPALNGGPRV